MNQERANTRLLSGSIAAGTLSLAWPIAAQILLEFALGITDFYFIGWLGAEEQDALASSLIVVWTVYSVITLITIGVNAVVARHYGAAEMGKASSSASQGVKLAIWGGLFCSVAGYFSREFILVFMDAEPGVIAHGVEYLQFIFLATPLMFLEQTFGAVFRATGDTRRPMIVGITGVGLNIALDPILIFGWGPIPALGVAGAALGTFLSLFVDLALYLIFIKRGRLSLSLSGVWREKLERTAALNIARIGAPIAAQSVAFVGVYSILLQIVHRFGHVAGAAMGVGNRIESINYHVCSALSMAAATIVGQNLGAGQPERAQRSAWVATGMGIAFTSLTTILFVGFPDQLAGFFTTDTAVLAVARDYLIIVGLSQVFMAVEIVIDGSFSGAGDTVPPMLVSLPGSFARIPLAYYFAVTLAMGVSGVWLAIALTTFVKALILAIWFKRGNWKTKPV